MKILTYLLPLIIVSQIIQADTMELITKNIKSVCASPDQKSKYWEVKAEGKNNMDIKLLGMENTLKGTISKGEWEGIQTVLKKQQAKENQNYRECVKYLTPIFMNNFKQDREKEKSPLLIKKDKFSINLSVYEEGDLPDELGKELVIKNIDKQNIIAGLQSKPAGYVEIKGLNLTKKFMFTILNDINSRAIEFILRTRDDDIDNDLKIALVGGYNLTFGNTKKGLNMTENNYNNGYKVNEFKFYMKKNVVKFYINETYFGSIKANNKVVYDKFIIKSLDPKDYIYDISGYNITN